MSGNSEMVSRIAKAMQASKAWPAVFNAGTAEILAAHALQAIREPTDAMCHATGDGPATSRRVWQAMLSEALSPSLKEQERT